MKRKILIFLIFINFISSTALAVEPSTPSADLKSKLKTLQEQIASRASQLKNEVGQKLQNKAYVGFIKSESNTAITLATNKGTKLININEFTQYVNLIKGGKSKNVKDLVVDDYIVALGDVDDNEVLTAKKIIKFTPDKEIEKRGVFGDVLSLENNSISLQTRQNQNITVNVSEDTIYKSAKGAEFSFEDIKTNKPIIVIGTVSKEGIIEAQFIYILPYTSNLKPKVATSSAKIASPSATLKKK